MKLFKFMNLSPDHNQKVERQWSPGKHRQSTTSSETETHPKAYSKSHELSLPPLDGIYLHKKSSDLGLIEGSEEDQDNQLNTHVEIDLVKNIKTMAKSKQFSAIGGLVGAFMVHLIVGAIYRWNMITGYVGLYFGSEHWTPVGAPLAMLCTGLTMRFGFKLSSLYGSRWVLIIGIVAATLSTIIASTATTFPAFLLFHNVIYGLAAGLLFLPPLKQCHRFFPRLKLVTNSIILTGTGLGAVLFGAYNIECIEHGNQTFQLDDMQLSQLVSDHFLTCFLKMGIIVFVIGVCGVGLMIPMILRNEEKDRSEREQSMQERGGNFCRSEWESFQSRVFWVIAIMIFLTSCGNYYVIMNFKNLLAAEHQEKLFLYWILISGALGNGLTRLLWGFLSSRVGFKLLFCASAALNLSAFVVIMATNDETIYLIFYTLNSISLGGLMVIIPNVSLLVFGKRIGESIYSYYWMTFSLSNFFQFFITLILTNNPTTSDDYGEVLFFFSLCVISSIVLVIREKLQGPWKNSLDLVEFKRSSRKYNS